MIAKTKKVEEPQLTLEEIRTALEGEEQEVYLKLTADRWDNPNFLKGKTPAEITWYLNNVVAKEPNFPKKFKLDYKTIPVTKWRTNRKFVQKVTTEKEGPYWVLVGYRPYSDEELLEKGAKLIAAKKKREEDAAKKLQKKVDAYNKKCPRSRSAAELVEDLS